MLKRMLSGSYGLKRIGSKSQKFNLLFMQQGASLDSADALHNIRPRDVEHYVEDSARRFKQAFATFSFPKLLTN
jgi:hypothetical protein